MLTLPQLAAIAGREANDNMRSVLMGLSLHGATHGLHRPHRLAHYLAQLGHESGRFRFDREVWGPTAAQARYDTRTDLGNTAARDGDGKLYMGRTGIQVTGRDNYRAVTAWLRSYDPSSPDFEAEPDKINADPWEGIAPIWFWATRGLNTYADRNHIETITKRVNGGLNGYVDRLALYTRSALVLLGRDPDDVRGFQSDAGLEVDGDAGPLTRGAMHGALAALALAPAEPPTPAPAPAPEPAVPDLDRIRALAAEMVAELNR